LALRSLSYWGTLQQVIRLNDKTVTLLCGQQQWRVAYAFLHRVVDADTVEQNIIKIEDNYLEKPKA
jgi:hypothetical protein